MKAPSWCQAPPTAGVGLAQRRLVHREQPALAEVALDQPRQPGALVEVEHPGRERRRVRRQHAAALLDPRPLGDLVARSRARTPRRGPARPRRRVARRAGRRGRSRRRSSSASSRGTSPRTSRQPSRRIAGAQQPGRHVGRRDLGQPAGRQRGLVGRGVVRRALARRRSGAPRRGGAAAAARARSPRWARARHSWLRRPISSSTCSGGGSETATGSGRDLRLNRAMRADASWRSLTVACPRCKQENGGSRVAHRAPSLRLRNSKGSAAPTSSCSSSASATSPGRAPCRSGSTPTARCCRASWARDELDIRVAGVDWPLHGTTMAGLQRLDDLQACVEAVVRDEVEGDLIEAGTWRGGASILMRATLDALGADRTVWVADSFQGFPTADEALAPIDYLAVPVDDVRANFARFGYEQGVRFVEGFFEDTLPGLAGPALVGGAARRRHLRGDVDDPAGALPGAVGRRLRDRRRLRRARGVPARRRRVPRPARDRGSDREGGLDLRPLAAQLRRGDRARRRRRARRGPRRCSRSSARTGTRTSSRSTSAT